MAALLDMLLPPDQRSDAHPHAREARTAALLGLVAAGLGLLALLHRLTDPAVADLSLVPVVLGIALSLGTLALLRLGLGTSLVASVMFTSAAVVLTADGLHWGGIRGAGLGALVALPVVSAFVVSARGAVATGWMCAGALVLSTLLGPLVNPTPPPLTSAGRIADAAVLAVLILLATALAARQVRAREQLARELRRRESRLVAALAATHAGTFDWRRGRGMVAANTRLPALLGEAPGSFRELDADDAELLRRTLEELPPGEERTLVLRRGTPDGALRLHIDLLGVGDPDGLGVVGVVHDVTEAHRVAHLREEFVSVVGHELRTPLTSIRGALSLMQHARLVTPAPEQAEAYAQLMRIADDNSRRLLRLIDDLLDVQHLDAGTLQLHLEPVRVDEVLAAVVASTRDYAEVCGTPVQLGRDGTARSVLADRRRLQQVLEKLVLNACKWSPRGAEVHLTVAAEAGRLRLLVSDSGSGIPEAFQPYVFTRFAQAGTGSARPSGGAGLGLFIARSVTERMGGSIHYESRTGVGSVFWVEFPEVAGTAD